MRCWATTTDTPAQGAEGLGSMGGGRDEAPGPSRLVLAEDAPPTPPAGSHAPGTFVCVVGGGGVPFIGFIASRKLWQDICSLVAC